MTDVIIEPIDVLEGFVDTPLAMDVLAVLRLESGGETQHYSLNTISFRGDACEALEVNALYVLHQGERFDAMPIKKENQDLHFCFEQRVALETIASIDESDLLDLPEEKIEDILIAQEAKSALVFIEAKVKRAIEEEIEIQVAYEALDPVSELIFLQIDPIPREPLLPKTIEAVSEDELLQWRLICDVYERADYLVLWMAFHSITTSPSIINEEVWSWVDRLASIIVDTQDQAMCLKMANREGRHDFGLMGRQGIMGPEYSDLRLLVELGGLVELWADQEDRDAGYISLVHNQMGDILNETQEPARLELVASVPQPDMYLERFSAGFLQVFNDALNSIKDPIECKGGLLTTMGQNHRLSDAFPYEVLAGIERDPRNLKSYHNRARSPGYRMFIPGSNAIEVSPLLRHKAVANGLLVGASSDDPFCMSNEELQALERVFIKTSIA